MKMLSNLVFVLLLSAAGFAQQKQVLPVNDFEKAIHGKGAQLVDVRTAEEFKADHIPGAVNYNWLNEKDFAEQAKKLDKSQPVYVYCLSGVRSGKAADWLAANGFIKVINLEGGIKAWKEAGKKVDK